MNNLTANILRNCDKYEGNIALRYFENDEIVDRTYGELKKDILSAVAIIKDIKEERIAIIGMTSYQWICVAYASIFCGKHLIMPDATLSISDLKTLMNTTDVEYVILTDEREELEAEFIKERPTVHIFMEDIYSKELVDEQKLDNKVGDVICFTSGTSKLAKGVVLGYDTIEVGNETALKTMPATVGDRIFIPTPTYHIMGFMITFTTLSKGMTACFARGVKTVRKDIKLLEPKLLVMVPSILEFLLNTNGITSSVEKVIVGGGVLRKEIYDKGCQKGIKVYNGYGLSELCGHVAVSMDASSVDKLKICEGVNVIITDEGEISIKYAGMMKGYYNNEEATNEVIRDGIFYTGDLGYVDEENNLIITGRKKDIIVMDNGEKVNCLEVDGMLNDIEGVREAAIAYINKELVAILVADDCYSDSINKIIGEYNKEQPFFRKIARIVIRQEALPRTASGKLMRRKLEED